MPNYITTIIRADQDILNTLLDPHGDTDFNTVIPTPNTVYQGTITADRRNDPNTWYVWNRENWGTKWNALTWEPGTGEHTQNPGELRFETAWNHPLPVVVALSRKFPDTTIRVAYADEDTGSNLDVYEIVNGEYTRQTTITEHTPEANNLAHLIRHGITAYTHERQQREQNPEWYTDADPIDPAEYLNDHYDPFTLINTDNQDA